MKKPLATAVFLVFLVTFFASSARAQLSAGLGDRVSNWTPAGPLGIRPLGILTDVTPPRAFIGVAPCRIVDTRGPAGPYGAPALAAGVSRNFALPGGPCAGIPTGVNAYSLNITVTNTAGPGFILMYPQGGTAPLVSTLNYVAGQTVANAAIIPAGTGGGITVIAGVSGTDLIIDINGYFSSVLGTPGNFFSLDTNSGGYTMFLRNLSTTCGGICGIRQEVNGTGLTEAIAGVSNGTGAGIGVYGVTSGTALGAAGVKGLESSGEAPGSSNFSPAGLMGSSISNNGVLGTSQNAGFAVRGFSVDGTGAIMASGTLGFSNGLGVQYFNGLSGTGAKTFVEPHPTDASKVIKYVSLEGPEAGTYFRGRAHFERGLATIEVPESFRMVSAEEGLSIQITPIGEMATYAVLSVGLDEIVVRGSRDVDFFYTVNGVRRAIRSWNPIQDNDKWFVPSSPDDRLPAYLSADERARLIQNGTYKDDGTVNMETAKALGWDKVWAAARERRAPEPAAAAIK